MEQDTSSKTKNVTADVESPVQVSPIPKHKNKLLLILTGILIFILVGGGLYYLGTGQNKSDSSFLIQSTLSPTSLATKSTISQTANQNSIKLPTITNTISATSPVVSLNNKENWKIYENQYFLIHFPMSWKLNEEINKGKDELALFHLNDGTPFGNSYIIHVLHNSTGVNAMTFAKNDITTNWEKTSGPIYAPYLLQNFDAVVVNNINAGKGAWGPSVYIVNKSIAVQIISENPLDNPNNFFNPIVNTFSFTNIK